ncbi:hypothetical protein [Sphingomonas sp.]|jgi:hypothetical protein|uniref:hypothetical protein n=1 Tax=Sphingomonas sp. TaxID=28214 RepID=UPI002ED8E4F4
MTADARRLIERAWDARTPKTRAKHARAAIEADPDALDGYVLLGQSLTDAEAARALYQEGAARGRRIWATAMKAPARHHFWLDLDTRPFMRVIHLHALALWDAGARSEAIGEAKTLLRLNRNDNQGIRELLAVWYPATGDWSALAKLLARYPDDWSTSRAYAMWLLAFRDGSPGAEALEKALEINPHVPRFLADPEARVDADSGDRLPLPGYVVMGSPAEAQGYSQFARDAWIAVPGAIERLVADAGGARAGD